MRLLLPWRMEMYKKCSTLHSVVGGVGKRYFYFFLMKMYIVTTTLGVNMLIYIKITVHINFPICAKQYVKSYSVKHSLPRKQRQQGDTLLVVNLRRIKKITKYPFTFYYHHVQQILNCVSVKILPVK